jgi:hypothetical protein
LIDAHGEDAKSEESGDNPGIRRILIGNDTQNSP